MVTNHWPRLLSSDNFLFTYWFRMRKFWTATFELMVMPFTVSFSTIIQWFTLVSLLISKFSLSRIIQQVLGHFHSSYLRELKEEIFKTISLHSLITLGIHLSWCRWRRKKNSKGFRSRFWLHRNFWSLCQVHSEAFGDGVIQWLLGHNFVLFWQLPTST